MNNFNSKKFAVILITIAAITGLSILSLLTPAASGALTTITLAYLGAQGYIDSK
jgi:hypothetical protein